MEEGVKKLSNLCYVIPKHLGVNWLLGVYSQKLKTKSKYTTKMLIDSLTFSHLATSSSEIETDGSRGRGTCPSWL